MLKSKGVAKIVFHKYEQIEIQPPSFDLKNEIRLRIEQEMKKPMVKMAMESLPLA
jgi:hypothetical protein